MNVHIKRTAACAALLLSLTACTAQKQNLLAYQSSLASISLEEGGRVWLLTPADGGCSAVITAPASAQGITFTVRENTVTASAGGITIPLGGRMSSVAANMTACLAFSESEITEVKAAPEEKCSVITFADGSRAAVSDSGDPLWFERSGVRYTVVELTKLGASGDEAPLPST